MSLNTAIQVLKAAADSTRLRLLALLAHGEASVGELQDILGQSQPRVSRHLRLLDEAGLVVNFRDGHWVYYRLTEAPASRALIDEALTLIGADDQDVARDRAALDRVKRNRERDVFSTWAMNTVGMGERPSTEELAEVIDECSDDLFDGRQPGEVLDIGCGGGALLHLFGRRAHNVVGIDNSRRMRLLARSRVHRAGLANCTVRKGDLSNLSFEDDAFDVVILDEVLGGSDDVLSGLNEARRVLRPDGQLLIIDRVNPVARPLPRQRDSARLTENQLTAILSEFGFRIAYRHWFPGRVMEFALFAAVTDSAQQRTGTYD